MREGSFLADDGTPVEMGLVLGWMDGDAEIKGLALGNVRRRWDRSWCRRLCELGGSRFVAEGVVVTAVDDAANAAVGMQRCGLWVVGCGRSFGTDFDVGIST